MTTEEMIRAAEAYHSAQGTDVRCPTCQAPAGAFCRENGQRAAETHADRMKAAGR